VSDKTVFMFPGQGSQYVGMKEALGPLSEPQKALFEQADELLDFPLTQLIDSGDQRELTRTYNAQPALLVTGMAAALAVEGLGYSADFVMGHSLGEYTALVYTGALSFDDGIGLVRTRGRLMARAVERSPGKMAAVIRADITKLEETIAEVAENEVLEISNLNSPGQVVLSGEVAAIDRAVEAVNSRRLGRAIPLDVAAPFHCSLMAPMAAEFEEVLAGVTINKSRYGFIDNVSGGFESDPERIRNKLVAQLTSPVLWAKSVLCAYEAGASSFLECGPKKVLSGLVKRTVREVDAQAAETLLKV